MKLADRAVNWTTMSAHEAARVVRFSDSSPGSPHTFRGIKYRLFGASPEGGGGCGGCGGCGGGDQRCGSETDEVLSRAGAEPGDPVGETNQSCLISVSAARQHQQALFTLFLNVAYLG